MSPLLTITVFAGFAVVVLTVFAIAIAVIVRRMQAMVLTAYRPLLDANKASNRQAIEWAKRALSLSEHEMARVADQHSFEIAMRHAEKQAHYTGTIRENPMTDLDSANSRGIPPDVQVTFPNTNPDLVG